MGRACDLRGLSYVSACACKAPLMILAWCGGVHDPPQIGRPVLRGLPAPRACLIFHGVADASLRGWPQRVQCLESREGARQSHHLISEAFTMACGEVKAFQPR